MLNILKLKVSGLDSERATPVPIPNTEVKPFSADGTARAAVWESRTRPGFYSKRRQQMLAAFFFAAKFNIFCKSFSLRNVKVLSIDVNLFL